MQVRKQPIGGPSSATRDDPPEVSIPRSPPAAETMRLYKTDWTAFATWCEATGLAALPAAPATVPGILRAAAERLSAARWAAVPPPSPPNTAGAVSLRQSPIRW